MKHPGHTYGGFVPAISERGLTLTLPTFLNCINVPREFRPNGLKHEAALGGHGDVGV
jgi:hypothetical protein